MVLCPDALSKCMFLDNMAHSADCGVIFLDFDLLYSGYIKAGILEQPGGLLLRQPCLRQWGEELTSILRMISTDRYLVIMDSLNGMASMMPDRDAARLANYSMMLLASVGRDAGTGVVAAAVAVRGKDKWEMPGGQLPNTEYFVLEIGPPMGIRGQDGLLLAV